MNNRYKTRVNAREKGAVLFVALVFLVLISLLALTASRTSVMEERMTGGLRNAQLALMGAESAARDVEWKIWNKSNDATSNRLICGPTGGADFCYQPSNVSGAFAMSQSVGLFRNQRGWPSSTDGDGATAYSTNMTALSGAQAAASLAHQPRYLIEDLGVLLPPGAPNNGNGGGRLATDPRNAGSSVVHTYRITSRAAGGNANSVAATESYFVAQPPSN